MLKYTFHFDRNVFTADCYSDNIGYFQIVKVYGVCLGSETQYRYYGFVADYTEMCDLMKCFETKDAFRGYIEYYGVTRGSK